MYFSILVGCIPLVTFFFVIFFWSYKFVYHKGALLNYASRVDIPVSNINEYIHKNFNQKFETRLARIDDSELGSRIRSDKGKGKQTPEAHFARHKPIGILFCITIALSLELIFILMASLMDIFNEDSRVVCFHLVVTFLVISLAFVQPFVLLCLFFLRDVSLVKISNMNRIKICLSYCVWLYFLHKCGDLSQKFRPNESSLFVSAKSIKVKINQISIVGITITAVLSAVGTVSTAVVIYKDVSKYFQKGKTSVQRNSNYTTQAQVNELISSYNNTKALIRKRTVELETHIQDISGRVYNMPTRSSDNILLKGDGNFSKNKIGGILHKVRSFASLTSVGANRGNSEELELQNEIDSLHMLLSQIYEDLLVSLARLKKMKEHLLGSKNIRYQLFRIMNLFFGIYCIYRLVDVFFMRFGLRIISSYFSDSTTNSGTKRETEDALAITISKILLSITNATIDERMLTNQISFLLTGGLFFCSISNTLKTFKSIGSVFPIMVDSSIIRDEMQYLYVSEFLGVYVIATAMLIRTNLPSYLSQQVSNMLSLSGSSSSSVSSTAEEIKFIDDWFDSVFAVICIITFVLLYLWDYFKDSTVYDSYDEEMLLENPYTE